MGKFGVEGKVEVVCGQVWGGRKGGGNVWASVGWKERWRWCVGKCGVEGKVEVVCGQVWGGRKGRGSVWASVEW